MSERLDEIDARAINAIPIGVDAQGVPVEARAGRYGPYLSRGEDRASIPDDLPPDELTIEKAIELLEAPKGDRVVGADPVTGLPVYAKAGRFGPYVQLGELEEGAKAKPTTASLFKTMDVDTVTLDQALQLLSLPRTVGADPDSGEAITAQNGRYGPYLKKGNDSRSLDAEEQIFTVTLDDALRIFAQPKLRRGQVAKPPLRELGADPATGLAMVLKDGRFGPYVTDGETNASLRKGDAVETITVERASELLADRRAAGPAKKRGRKSAAKKTTKKATKKAAEKTAKKATKKAAEKTAKKAAKKTTKAAAKKAAGKAAADPSPEQADGGRPEA